MTPSGEANWTPFIALTADVEVTFGQAAVVGPLIIIDVFIFRGKMMHSQKKDIE